MMLEGVNQIYLLSCTDGEGRGRARGRRRSPGNSWAMSNLGVFVRPINKHACVFCKTSDIPGHQADQTNLTGLEVRVSSDLLNVRLCQHHCSEERIQENCKMKTAHVAGVRLSCCFLVCFCDRWSSRIGSRPQSQWESFPLFQPVLTEGRSVRGMCSRRLRRDACPRRDSRATGDRQTWKQSVLGAPLKLWMRTWVTWPWVLWPLRDSLFLSPQGWQCNTYPTSSLWEWPYWAPTNLSSSLPDQKGNWRANTSFVLSPHPNEAWHLGRCPWGTQKILRPWDLRKEATAQDLSILKKRLWSLKNKRGRS